MILSTDRHAFAPFIDQDQYLEESLKISLMCIFYRHVSLS